MKKNLFFVVIMLLVATSVRAQSYSDTLIWKNPTEVKIYPVPIEGPFTVKIYHVDEDVTIYIYNGIGRKIYETKEIPETETVTKKISLEFISDGIYCIVLQTKEKILLKTNLYIKR